MKRYIAKEWPSILVLPLSSVLLGSMLAIADFKVKPSVIAALIFTAIIIKIVSVVKRNKVRFASEKSYNIAFWTFLLLFLVSFVLLVYLSYGTIFCLDAFVFLLLGYFLLRIALRPTERPVYLEAIYTISLYGPIAVICVYMLCSHTVLGWSLLLPAFSIGFLVAAAKDVSQPIYHTLLIVAGFICMIAYAGFKIFDLYHFLFLLSLPLFIIHLVKHRRNPEGRPSTLLLLSILIFTILAGLGYLLFPVFGISTVVL